MAGVIYTVGHSYARAQGDEKLVQLRERLGHSTLHPGDGTVESFLRGIEFVHDQQRLATFFLEGHRGDGTVVTFVISPNEARGRYHFDVPAEERHRLRGPMAELETVPAPDTNVRFAGQ